MPYSVTIKRGLFRKTILKDVLTDGFTEGGTRYFILTDDTAREFPPSCEFGFSKERLEEIRENQKKEAEAEAKAVELARMKGKGKGEKA